MKLLTLKLMPLHTLHHHCFFGATLWVALTILVSVPVYADKSDPMEQSPETYRALGYRSTAELLQAPKNQRPHMDATCPGGYLLSLFPGSLVPSTDIWAYADHIDSQHEQLTHMDGHVDIRETDKVACSDKATMNQVTNLAEMSGHLLLSEPGYAAQGSQGQSNLKTQSTHIQQAHYVLSTIHAYGYAQDIDRSDQGITIIRNGAISTCSPYSPDWWLKAKKIRLNPAIGRGEAYSSVVYAKELPLIYLPYINFPIDNRRQTGLLMPVMGSNSLNGVMLSLPVYLNIAPNYDATITPTELSKRGLWLQGDFRYLETFGHGEIQGGYLNNDRSGFPLNYNPLVANPDSTNTPGLDRKALGWQHNGSFAEGWTVNTDINYVSDNYYYQDLGATAALSTSTFQNRMGAVNYRDKNWSFMSQLQSYQILDPTVTGINKPYDRFPEASLGRIWTTPDHLLSAGFNLDDVDFRRQIHDGSGLSGNQVILGDPYIQGVRMRSDAYTSMRLEAPWGYFAPKITLKHLSDQLNNELPSGSVLSTADNVPLNPSVTVPSLNVDTGLSFERSLQNGGLETLEPRLYYLRAPYQNQNMIPVFDTIENPLTYAQMFRDSRFVGNDRLDDADQLALGINNRWLDSNGNENFRLSIGDMRYFRPLYVYATMPPPNTLSTGVLTDLNAHLTKSLTVTGNLSMDPSIRFAQRSGINLHWQPEKGQSLFNIGINYIHSYTGYSIMQGLSAQSTLITVPTFRLASASFVRPLNDRWQLLGLWEYDLALYHTQQAIGGIQYESCCWRARLVDSIYLSDFLAVNNVPTYNRTVMFQFEFKGLGGYSRQLDSMLNQAILGYQQIASSEKP